MSTKEQQLKKLITFQEDKDLAIFDELNEVNQSIKEVIEAVKNSKIEEVAISNLKETDLSGIEESFKALKEEIENVVSSIKSIKNVDLSGIEKLLTKISKEEKLDLSRLKELTNISSILQSVLYAVQSNVATPTPDIPNPIPKLDEIQKILNVLNDNLIAFEIPELDYEKLAEVIKDNISIVVGGGGSGAVVNKSDVRINPATEEKQDTLITNTTVGTAVAGNSSTTPLGIGGVFTGVAVDTKDYVTVNVAIKSDVASATDGLSLQFSSDGTNWDIPPETHTISAGVGIAHLSRAKARYFRVVYTNGGTAQTYFRLAVLLKNTAVSMTYEQLSMSINDSHDAAVVRAIIAGKKPNGDYTNFQSTTAGNFKCSLEELETGVNLAQRTTGTSAVTSVASSASNVTLLASNTSRRMATFYNDSTAIAYLKLGATATTSSYTVQIPPQTYYELPMPCYTGIIDCIWASANGNMLITSST